MLVASARHQPGFIRRPCHIATSLSLEPDETDYAPFSQQGGLGRAHQLFGPELNRPLDERNLTLAA